MKVREVRTPRWYYAWLFVSMLMVAGLGWCASHYHEIGFAVFAILMAGRITYMSGRYQSWFITAREVEK